MAKNKKTETETEAPKPTNRAVKPSMVRVRANRAMGEEGQTYAPGAEFTVPAERVPALGKLVSVLD